MSLFRIAVVAAIFAGAVSQNSAAALVARNVNTQDMDRSVRPGDDFYRFANGGWLKVAAVPTGQSSYGTSVMLKEKTSEQVRQLIQEASTTEPLKGSVTQKVGDYYGAFMDQDGIEAKGM